MNRRCIVLTRSWMAAGILVAAISPGVRAADEAAGAATAAPSVASFAAQAIPAGTPVRVALKQRLRSGQAKKGDPVAFAVAADVRTPDGARVLIPAGTPAYGIVEEARGGGSFGRPGRLKVRCEYAELPGGTRVPLEASVGNQGAGRRLGAAVTVGAGAYVAGMGALMMAAFGDDSAAGPILIGGVATSVLLGSAWRGGNVTFEEGRVFLTTVSRNVTAPGSAAPAPETAPAAPLSDEPAPTGG
jgi:hypothetical protein